MPVSRLPTALSMLQLIASQWWVDPSSAFDHVQTWIPVLACVMQLLIWFVNSNVENAFSTGLIGTLYGPIFPACLTMANELLPPNVHMSSMAIMWVFAFAIPCWLAYSTWYLCVQFCFRQSRKWWAGTRLVFEILNNVFLALFPFISGTVASLKGAQTITYFMVSLGAMMICLWSMCPSRLPSQNYAS
jgi:hypothetical protein